MLDLKTRHG